LRASAPIARVLAVVALAAAIVLAAILLLGGASSGYTVKAHFQNAAQLVKGNLVQVSGVSAGTVDDIRLTADGQAEVILKINGDYAPLRRGTEAIIRQASLSGVANRYVDLRLGPDDGEEIPNEGVLEQDATTTAVDLDAIFNTLDEDTRKSLQNVLKGSERQYRNRGEQMNAALPYLNPSLSSSSRLFRELNRDSKLLSRFVVANSQLVTDLADRRTDLAGLVDQLATTMTAIGSESDALGESIGRLPDFMRRANTTFLNLRAALDDLEPLVDDSKPVAKKLRPFLAELRPLAKDARPTLRDLADLLRKDGEANDAVELTQLQPDVRNVAVRDFRDNGATREGAFPASTKALDTAAPELAFLRPYTQDLIGWFDDFSHTGIYDALGGTSRVGIHANPFIFADGQLRTVPLELRDEAFQAVAATDQRNRCPGSAEHDSKDGTNPYKPYPSFNCDETQRLPGE
jgi:phospholipid/cholesterol/gamma-HCH transport system substrate-binding protein